MYKHIIGQLRHGGWETAKILTRNNDNTYNVQWASTSTSGDYDNHPIYDLKIIIVVSGLV